MLTISFLYQTTYILQVCRHSDSYLILLLILIQHFIFIKPTSFSNLTIFPQVITVEYKYCTVYTLALLTCSRCKVICKKLTKHPVSLTTRGEKRPNLRNIKINRRLPKQKKLVLLQYRTMFQFLYMLDNRMQHFPLNLPTSFAKEKANSILYDHHEIQPIVIPRNRELPLFIPLYSGHYILCGAIKYVLY